MLSNDAVADVAADAVSWRHHIHANPELGFEEHGTARFVAEHLRAFGLEVHEGIAGTGVVGVLRRGTCRRAVGLRAELDALPIVERTDLPYASRRPGVMHACGHDGHAAMLLGAAKLLARSQDFDGTVVFIFQPAEENDGGGLQMVEAGLFRRFPVDSVHAVHNWPGLPLGAIAVRDGPQMAAVDRFEVRFAGLGSHAAMPHRGDDPILAAGAFIQGLQRVVSRSVDPLASLVVSLTEVHGGHVGNVVPAEVRLKGTCRFFDPGLSGHCEARIGAVAAGIATAHGLDAVLDYRRGYPAVINAPNAAAVARTAAAAAVGAGLVMGDVAPSLGCEDFAYMLRAVGGAYAWIGAGDVGPDEGLHGSRYAFNDAIVPVGIRYWTSLVTQMLPRSN